MAIEKLTYHRMATKAKDGKSGPLYIHSWPTGFQELIFDNHEAATKVQSLFNNPEKLAEWHKQPA